MEQVTAGFWLSPQQQRVWTLQAEGASPYVAVCELSLEGLLDSKKLHSAIELAVSRHEILRTVFHHQPGVKMPFQVIRENGSIRWLEYDLIQAGPTAEATREAIWTAAKSSNFDLLEGPLLHATLVKIAAEVHVLLLAMPALNGDAATLPNLAAEILRCYVAALGQGELPDEVLQYADVAQWQQELLESDEAKAGQQFWKEQLRELDLQSLLDLSLPSELKSGADFSPASFNVNCSLCAEIGALGQKHGFQVSDFLLACWQLLLARFIGGPELLIGLAADGRRYEELRDALGVLTRYLPQHSSSDEESSFLKLVKTSADSARSLAKWQESLLPEQLEAAASGFGYPFVFEYSAWPELTYAVGVRASLLRQWVCTDRYKLKLACVRANGSLQLELHYDQSRYGRQAIEQLARCFETLLTAAVANPEALASTLPLLDEAERRRISVHWNDTTTDYSREQTIAGLLEQQAAKTANRVALVCGDQQLTYAELNRQANQLAHHLRKLGVGPDALVGLCLERSTELMVALLAILKAGGAYVPLNPDNPPARTAQQLAGAHVLITQEKLLSQMPSSFAGQTLCIDRDRGQWAQESGSNLPATAGPENLVYVIYTSGSTGVPKGVAVRHRNLVNYSEFICRRLELDKSPDGLNFGTVSTIGADLGNTCIYPSLISGGTLHLVSYEVATDSRKLAEYNEGHQIDVLKIVPSHLGALLNSEEGVRVLPRRFLILGGEALSWALVDKVRAIRPSCEIINHYGPTETTVGSLTLRLAEVPQLSVTESATVPIGRPIANTQVYVLDQHRAPVPVGVAGELYIGGEGVTAGYLNQAEKTAERFVPDPFSQNPNARLYRTGDLARYLPDGQVEFLGRGDDQVKVRGFRIELGEVESVLASQPGMKQVAVLAREEKDTGEKRLVAYLVTSRDHPPTTEMLRQKLREQLPDYMVPSALIIVDKLPLNANGKVDRKALPAPEDVQGQARAYIAPRTPIEEVVANIWAEVLHREQVGAEDNFFDLGGHSLLATQVVSRVRRVMSVELPLRALFEAPTVGELAGRIEATRREQEGLVAPPIEWIPRDGALPLSFAQQRLWFVNQLDPHNPAYNVSRAIRIRGKLNVAVVERCLNEIVRRHETQRTSFKSLRGNPVQIIVPSLVLSVPVVDLSSIPQDSRHAEAVRVAREEAERPFDLAEGPLLRVSLLRLGEEEHVLLLNMHHIVSDAWSAAVFVREFGTLYEAFAAGRKSPLEDLPMQYADYASWQRKWLQGEVLDKQLSYWKTQLQGAPQVLELPSDRPRPRIQSLQGDYFSVPLSKQLSERLKELSRREGVTLFMTMLAAYQVLLGRYSGSEQLIIGTDLANRTTVETEKLMGFFINVLPLRADLSGDPTFRELLARVRESSLGAFAHQEMPLDKIVEELSPERSLSHNPLIQVLFVMQNTPRTGKAIPGLEISYFEVPVTRSKFDVAYFVMERADELLGTWLYSTDLFERTTIERMARHYATLLASIVAEPEARLSGLRMLTEEEQKTADAQKKQNKESKFKKFMNVEPKAVSLGQSQKAGKE